MLARPEPSEYAPYVAHSNCRRRTRSGCPSVTSQWRWVRSPTTSNSKKPHATPRKNACSACSPRMQPAGPSAMSKVTSPPGRTITRTKARRHSCLFVADSERLHPPCLRTGEEFVAAARRVGVPADLEVLQDRTHRTTLGRMTSPGDPCLHRIVQFVVADR